MIECKKMFDNNGNVIQVAGWSGNDEYITDEYNQRYFFEDTEQTQKWYILPQDEFDYNHRLFNAKIINIDNIEPNKEEKRKQFVNEYYKSQLCKLIDDDCEFYIELQGENYREFLHRITETFASNNEISFPIPGLNIETKKYEWYRCNINYGLLQEILKIVKPIAQDNYDIYKLYSQCVTLQSQTCKCKITSCNTIEELDLIPNPETLYKYNTIINLNEKCLELLNNPNTDLQLKEWLESKRIKITQENENGIIETIDTDKFDIFKKI